ncbi:MAG: hypothetical protein J6Y04_09180 [Bacteroidaceae bacterium]|nr:hypothetical protein [Bacteroidaceae bacterium]
MWQKYMESMIFMANRWDEWQSHQQHSCHPFYIEIAEMPPTFDVVRDSETFDEVQSTVLSLFGTTEVHLIFLLHFILAPLRYASVGLRPSDYLLRFTTQAS